MKADRRVILPLFAAVVLGLYFLFAPRLPREQVVEVVLGDAAPKVTEVRLAYDDSSHDWSSEVDLSFEGKPAPRVVHHESQMPDGAYKLTIDVTGRDRGTHLERNVTLAGGTISVDVSEAITAALGQGASR